MTCWSPRSVPEGSVYEYPIRIMARDGQVREALVNAVIFETRQEQLMIALLRDVTDARRQPRLARAKHVLHVCSSNHPAHELLQRFR